MKKIVSLAVLAALSTTVAGAAAPSHLIRNSKGGYDVTFNYADKSKTGWYVGGRVGLNLMSWENKYSVNVDDVDVNFDSDKYSFESVLGGEFFAGRKIDYFWRVEVEAGLLGRFEDKDDGFEFQMTVPYVVANAYYDFANGFYLGAGLGVAVPKTKLDGAEFDAGDSSKYSVSLMGALMAGYSHKLDSNLVLDLRYRLAGLSGGEHERMLDSGYKFKNKIGFILDNSLSLGLRYEF